MNQVQTFNLTILPDEPQRPSDFNMGSISTKRSGHDAAFEEKLEIRTIRNEASTLAFVALIILFVAGIAFSHRMQRRLRRQQYQHSVSISANHLRSHGVGLPRFLKRHLLRGTSCLPSIGHGTLIAAYFVVTVAFATTNMNNDNMPLLANLASRTAWLAMANMLLVIVLALKNTPIAWLTAWSYERLNIFHRVAGYMTVTHVIAHAGLYSAYFVHEGRSEMLFELKEIWGMVGGFCAVNVTKIQTAFCPSLSRWSKNP